MLSSNFDLSLNETDNNRNVRVLLTHMIPFWSWEANIQGVTKVNGIFPRNIYGETPCISVVTGDGTPWCEKRGLEVNYRIFFVRTRTSDGLTSGKLRFGFDSLSWLPSGKQFALIISPREQDPRVINNFSPERGTFVCQRQGEFWRDHFEFSVLCTFVKRSSPLARFKSISECLDTTFSVIYAKHLVLHILRKLLQNMKI